MHVARATDPNTAILPRETLFDIRHVTKRIGILVSEGFSLHDVCMLAEVFRLANDASVTGHADMPYALVMLSEQGGSVASDSSLRVWSEALASPAAQGFDTLFVVGGPTAGQGSDGDRLVKRLHAIAPKIRTIKAVGEGRSTLAALNRSYGSRSMANYPNAEHPDGGRQPIANVDPNMLVGAGTGAFVAALKVVQRDCGAAVAEQIAEYWMPGAWRRLGLILDDSEPRAVNSKINAAAQWIRENYQGDVTIGKAAAVAQMSERNFLRRFKAQTGFTPSEYLLRARLDASCVLLAETDLPIDTIARRCGVWSGDGLAKIFRKRLSISPSEYRAAHRHGVIDT